MKLITILVSMLFFMGCNIHYDDTCDPKNPDYHHTEWVCEEYGDCRSLHVCSWSPMYQSRHPTEQIVVDGEWLECYPQHGVWYGDRYEEYGYYCAYHPRRLCYYCPQARVR